MKRKLTLNRETLVDLTTAETARVAGASGLTCRHVTCGGPCHSDLVRCVTFGGCETVGFGGSCVLTIDGVC